MRANCVTITMNLLAGHGGQLVASAWVLALTVSAWAVLRWVRNALP